MDRTELVRGPGCRRGEPETRPGLAFGTGTHDTTALCLEWLDGADLNGRQVLDFGCGSGVLAIAALLLGAERALGTDIDPQALTASADNAAANGVADGWRCARPMPCRRTTGAICWWPTSWPAR